MEKAIQNLSKKLPDEAIQRTKREKTRKGYDTDGYGYQWGVNRLNDVLEDKWGFSWEIVHEEKGKYSSGMAFWDITVKVGIWIISKENVRFCVGGHTAGNYADALKGAITNGFKKTAAFWGIGKEAYMGTIDDDAILPDEDKNKTDSTPKGIPQKENTPKGIPQKENTPKETTKDEAIKFLNDLPPHVKEYFKSCLMNDGDKWDFCSKYNFDVSVIAEAARLLNGDGGNGPTK